MKNKILCPNCEQFGIKQTIGVILPNGIISIQRGYYKMGYREFTLIKGSDFTLICGKCSNEVFLRKGGKLENSSSRDRIFRVTFSETAVKFGIQGTGSFA